MCESTSKAFKDLAVKNVKENHHSLLQPGFLSLDSPLSGAGPTPSRQDLEVATPILAPTGPPSNLNSLSEFPTTLGENFFTDQAIELVLLKYLSQRSG